MSKHESVGLVSGLITTIAFSGVIIDWRPALCAAIMYGVFLTTILYLGSQADYWRMRSRMFYEQRQKWIDDGVVKWEDVIR